MSKRKPELIAACLLRKIKTRPPTLDDVAQMVTEAGFDIIDFDPSDRIGSAAVLIDRLMLRKYTDINPALTYKNGEIQLVFVNATLGQEEKTYALAHELGHIACGHLHDGSTEYSVTEEYEANEFAHYLLMPSTVGQWLRRHLAVCIAVVVLVCGGVIGVPLLRQETGVTRTAITYEAYGEGEYYVVEGGERYHEKNCMTIRNNETLHQMTEEEWESGRYTPCKVCLP